MAHLIASHLGRHVKLLLRGSRMQAVWIAPRRAVVADYRPRSRLLLRDAENASPDEMARAKQWADLVNADLIASLAGKKRPSPAPREPRVVVAKKKRVVRKLLLSEVLATVNYDPETGDFTWVKTPCNRVRAGRLAGHLSARVGYVRIMLGGRQYPAHRLAWFCVHGEWPHGVIDHINRNRADNRIANLRDVTQGENRLNSGPSAYLKDAQDKGRRLMERLAERLEGATPDQIAQIAAILTAPAGAAPA